MNIWGNESCSNDATMNTLVRYCKKLYNPTQEEADMCLATEFEATSPTKSIGLVMWFLQNDITIDGNYLDEALKFAEKELKEDLCESRKTNLHNEIEIIKSAQNNNGVSTKRYAKQLGDIMTRGTSVIERFRGVNTVENKE